MRPLLEYRYGSRQTDLLTGLQTDRQTHRQTDLQTDRQIDKIAVLQRERARQTDRQTDKADYKPDSFLTKEMIKQKLAVVFLFLLFCFFNLLYPLSLCMFICFPFYRPAAVQDCRSNLHFLLLRPCSDHNDQYLERHAKCPYGRYVLQ